MQRLAAVAALLMALAGCAGGDISQQPADTAVMERVWAAAEIFVPQQVVPYPVSPVVPERLTPRSLPRAELRPGVRVPVVVYSHGCSGGGSSEQLQAVQMLAANGYAVVTTNHFARPNARRVCEGSAGPGAAPTLLNFHAGYVGQRMEELRMAVDRTRELPFADPARIFIMGHSAGGFTVAQWNTADIAGAIVTGHNCVWPPMSGLRVPASVPTLFISDATDPWLGPTAGRFLCSEFTVGRANSTQIVLRNNDHAAIPYPETREAILRFLASLSARGA